MKAIVALALSALCAAAIAVGAVQAPCPEPAAAAQEPMTAAAAAATIRAFAGTGSVTFAYPAGTALMVGSGFDASGVGAPHQTGAIDHDVPTQTRPTDTRLRATTFLATSGTDVNDKLSISAKASMSYGTFSANMDVKFTQSTDRSARAMSLIADYNIAFAQTMYSSQPTLSAAAKELLNRAGTGGVAAFAKAYGQYYVYAITTGSKLLARSTITSSREEMITSLSVQADASGSYGAFSASVSAAVAKDQSIQSFSTTEETAVSAEGVDFSCLYPTGVTADPAPSPTGIDELLDRYKKCVGQVSAAAGGVPSTMVLARFDELPEWTWGPLAPVNSIFDDNSALQDAARYVTHYDSVVIDANEYMNQPGVPPATAKALRALNAKIRASKATIVDALGTKTEAELEALLDTLPFWGVYQAEYNRIVGDYRWSSCDWATHSNGESGGEQSVQSCPSDDTVPVVGGARCRPNYDQMMMYTWSIETPNDDDPAGWYTQCMNHDNWDMNAGSNLYLTCCYRPLLGACHRVERSGATTLECPAGQVLIGAGAKCNQQIDALLYQLEPTSTSALKAECMNHHSSVPSAPLMIDGHCCTLPGDATATFVQAPGDTSDVQCPTNSVLVNGGVTCHNDWDQFILQSYPSSLTAWSGRCVNHDDSWMQNAPKSASAVCVSFAEDQAPATGGGAAPANATRRATATEAFDTRTGLTLSLAQPKRIAHFDLSAAPTADVTVHFRATCNVVLGARGSVVVRSDGRCVADLTHGTITIPRGLRTASVQIVRAGGGAGARFAAKQSGVLAFVGRLASADAAWRGRPASLFTPVRITITD